MYPMDKKTQARVLQMIREIMFNTAEKAQVVMKPHEGEHALFDAALHVLRNAGVVVFDWNPMDQNKKPIIGAVLITLSVQGLLQIFENRFAKNEVN